jgi:hypothetical protein
MSRTGRVFPARNPNCDFAILTTAPAGGFLEIGAIDVQFGAYGSHVYRDLDSFKKEIRPYVCNAGGDAAIAFANGYGMYIKATILKSQNGPTQQSAPANGNNLQGGCSYDTQCKGDRVCINGRCVSPTATPGVQKAAAPGSQ